MVLQPVSCVFCLLDATMGLFPFGNRKVGDR
jgi:hypothetical protein